MLEHKAAECVHGTLHRIRKRRVAAHLRGDNHIRHHARNHRRCVRAECVPHLRRQICRREESRTQAVVVVMTEIGNAVGDADNTPLKRRRHSLSRMVQDTVTHRACEVQPLTAAFEHLYHAQALLIMGKMADDLLHDRLARMAERRMSNIMPEGNGLRQILVEPQSACNRTRDLRHLKTVRHARAVVVPRNDIDLRLVLQAPKRF